jgi:glycerophosphoryl diester phosphodiesterase
LALSVNWPYPKIVAHRGGGALAPENTLGAIRLGASMGFKGVEFDVMLAGDGTPVVIHDETLERTTNGQGSVPSMTYDELARFDAGQGERIPRYEDVVKLCRELGLWANVEIKPAQGHERATGEAVARMTREHWFGAPLAPVLSSFSVEALAGARSVAPGAPRGYLVDRIPDDWRDTMRRLGCVALHCNYKSLNEKLADEVHQAGYSILLWTVNDPAEARRMRSMGADCLVTDALDRIGPDFS